MKFVFPLPHMLRLKAMVQPWEASVTGAHQTRMVKRADELGYDMITLPEHFVIPQNHVELSGPHYFHSVAAQGYVAGATERIRIGTSVTILPLQNPIVMAKALSTVDWMSSGRIMVAFGVGWLEEEFKILGVPFHERGRMSDEYLAAIIELWTKERPSFEGKYVSFKDVAFEPKPFQKPHVPIWIGGDSDAALKRTARFASGWIPFLTKPDDIPARLDFIKSQPTYKGGPFEVMCGLSTGLVGEGHVVTNDPKAKVGMNVQELVDRLNALKKRGVTMSAVPIPPVKDMEAYLDHAQWVIEEIKPKVQ
ncbi:MAG: TIGR03619 family F420-dependent LLM class oxidoreductase [Rhodospirillaceae bacterium]|nr:MAG: TIGR03619 family F420-dependent LLM class oxidoreductase [Rhodospirillaceae bacterium]